MTHEKIFFFLKILDYYYIYIKIKKLYTFFADSQSNFVILFTIYFFQIKQIHTTSRRN